MIEVQTQDIPQTVDAIIFYDDDADGHCAAYTVAHFLNNKRTTEEKAENPLNVCFQVRDRTKAEMDHVSIIKAVDANQIFFVDYTPEDLNGISELLEKGTLHADRVQIFDHHPSATAIYKKLTHRGKVNLMLGAEVSASELAWFAMQMEELFENPAGMFDEFNKDDLAIYTDLTTGMDKETFVEKYSAEEYGRCCVDILYDECQDVKPLPIAVSLIGRYDVWDHGFSEHVVPFQYGLNIVDHDPSNVALWSTLFNAKYAEKDAEPRVIENIVGMGMTVAAYKESTDAWLMTQATERTFRARDGKTYNVLFVNAPVGSSYVYEHHEAWATADFSMSAYYNADGDLKVSMRKPTENSSGVDLSALAQVYGGGGHKNAAGFVVKKSHNVTPSVFLHEQLGL